jgi:hypothetical protein
MFVNLGRLDWRLREGKTDESKLLDSLLPFLKWGSKYDNPHVEAVEAVAYYQPRFALSFAGKLIKDGHGVSEKVCYIARNAAFTYDHLEEACMLLWRAGRKDDRALHQNPGHGIRLLKELAEFRVNKPVAYVEGVVNFALELLERPASLSAANSPFSILEGALETEMESTSYSRNTYTITRFHLPLEQAREVRRTISTALLRFIAAEPLRRAFLAALTLSNALRTPMHGGSSDGAWTREHLELLQNVHALLNQTRVNPVVLVGLAQSVSWHAFFSGSETSEEARSILKHLERDLRTRTTRVLIDGWGSETWEMNDAYEREGVEEYRVQVTHDLIEAFPKPEALLRELGSCLEDISSVAGSGYGSPFIFMNHLLTVVPGLAQALLTRDIEEGLSEHLILYVGQALSVAVGADEATLLQRYRALRA